MFFETFKNACFDDLVKFTFKGKILPYLRSQSWEQYQNWLNLLYMEVSTKKTESVEDFENTVR